MYTTSRILTTMGWSQILTAMGTFTLYLHLEGTLRVGLAMLWEGCTGFVSQRLDLLWEGY